MTDRVTVNFFHEAKGDQVQWMWLDASGHVPAPGDHVITPRGVRWDVVARTWQMHERLGGSELHCNVVVRDHRPTPEGDTQT